MLHSVDKVPSSYSVGISAWHCINQNKRCTGTCIVGVANMHGWCSFHVHQTGGWLFLSVFLHSSVKECTCPSLVSIHHLPYSDAMYIERDQGSL